MSTKWKDKIILVKRKIPKRITIPTTGRTFVSLYRRPTRDELPANIKIKRTCGQRPAPKNKRHRQRGRGLGKFLKIVMRSPIIKSLGKKAAEKLPDIYSKMTKK